MKICPECGATFPPTSNRQIRCKRCRFRAAPRPGATFGRRSCALCGVMFEATSPTQRFCGRACAARAARPVRKAKYENTGYRQLRRILEPIVEAGLVRCARGAACSYRERVNGVLVGGFIRPGEPWHLGHPDGESVGGAEHVRCNVSAPARLRSKQAKPWSTSRQ